MCMYVDGFIGYEAPQRSDDMASWQSSASLADSVLLLGLSFDILRGWHSSGRIGHKDRDGSWFKEVASRY